MSGDDLTDRQRELVTHAVNMDGWLTARYVHSVHSDDIIGLADGAADPLFVYEPGGIPVYRLTEAGWAVADELAVTG